MATKTNTKKLMIFRTEGRYDDDKDENDAAPGTATKNRKLVGDFIREAIHEAGFTTKKQFGKSDDYYSPTVRVFIKEFGGKCYIEAEYDYEDMGGRTDKDEVEVDLFTLQTTDYDVDLGVEYKKYSDIVKKLAADLNKNLGESKALSKGDAKVTPQKKAA